MSGIEVITFTEHYDADYQRKKITADKFPDQISVSVKFLTYSQTPHGRVWIDAGHICIQVHNGRARYLIMGVDDNGDALICQRVESELR